MGKKMIKKIIRKLTSWAWEEEISVYNGLAKITKLNMDENSANIEIEHNRELGKRLSLAFASLLLESPNYTEMKLDLKNPVKDFEYINVHIQKSSGKTPHQIRRELEIKINLMKGVISSLIDSSKDENLISELKKIIEILN